MPVPLIDGQRMDGWMDGLVDSSFTRIFFHNDCQPARPKFSSAYSVTMPLFFHAECCILTPLWAHLQVCAQVILPRRRCRRPSRHLRFPEAIPSTQDNIDGQEWGEPVKACHQHNDSNLQVGAWDQCVPVPYALTAE